MKEKNNKGLIWLIVVLIVLVLGLGGFIVYVKLTLSNNKENTTINITTTKMKDELVIFGTKTLNLNNNKIEFKLNYKEKKPYVIYADMFVNDKEIYNYIISDTSYIAEVEGIVNIPDDESFKHLSKQINIDAINDKYYILSYITAYESDPSNLFIKILNEKFDIIYDLEVIQMTAFKFDDKNMNEKFYDAELGEYNHYYVYDNEIYYYADKNDKLNEKGQMPVYKLTIKDEKVEKSIVDYYDGTISGYKY